MKTLMLSGLLLVLALSTSAQSLSTGKGDLRVMTYNVNEGTDFLEIQAATDQQSFLAAVVQTIAQVRATNPPARMQALAKQIARCTGSAGCPLQDRGSATTVRISCDTRCGIPQRPILVRGGRGPDRNSGAHRFGSLKVPSEQPTVSAVCERTRLPDTHRATAFAAGVGLR